MTYLVAAVFGLMGVWFWWANRVQHLNHLLELASRELQLPYVAPTVSGHQFGGEDEVFGRLEGRTQDDLRVSITIRNRAQPELWISVGSARLPPALIEPDVLHKATRDPSDDDPTLYVALMTTRARRLLRNMDWRARIALRGRRVQIQATGLSRDSLAVSEMPREAIALARELAFGADEMPLRLAHIAREDLVAEYAVRAARRLLREFPGHACVDEVVSHGLSHPVPAMRLLCAQHLGSDGTDVLLHLARRGDVPAAIRREALAALEPKASQRAATAAELSQRFGKTPDAILPELLQTLARLQAPLPMVELARRYGGVRSTSRAAILGHAGLHGPASERLALRGLADDQGHVQAASANVLAEVGTLAALPPLGELVRRDWASIEALDAAREAIHAIELRFGCGSGRLSVVDDGDQRGALAVASGAAGKLSVETEQTV